MAMKSDHALARCTGAAILYLALTACATTPTASKTSEAKPLTRQSLAPQKLASGDCGLFVWKASTPKSFLLFSQNTKGTGLWYNGSEEPIQIVAQSGEPAFGQFPDTRYTRPDGQALSLALSTPEPLEDGLAYKSGKLSFTTSDGWEKIIPVVGLSACKL